MYILVYYIYMKREKYNEYKSSNQFCTNYDEYKRDLARVEHSNSYSRFNCNVIPDIDEYEYFDNPIDLYLIKLYGVEYAKRNPLKSGIYKKEHVIELKDIKI